MVIHTLAEVFFIKLKYFYELARVLSQRGVFSSLAAFSDFVYYP